MIMKDGSEREDPRLGRLIQFDERSRQHPVRALLGAVRKPRNMTWPCPLVLDQGREGACVGFAITCELAAYPAPVPGLDNRFAQLLYYRAQERWDPWAGGEYPGADPRYAGTSVLAGVKAAKEAGYFEEYNWAFSLQDVLLGLSYHGPCVLGLEWRETMYDAGPDGLIDISGAPVGGHCILADQIDVNEKVVWLHNTWGLRYGRQGRAPMRWADLGALLAADGEAVFFRRRHKIPQPE